MNLVVITGCSKGLGLATCNRLLSEGYKIVGISRKLSSEFEKLQNSYKETLFFEAFDLSNIKEIQNLVRKITNTHGNIYGLINNAAVGYDGVLSTMHGSQIKEMIALNVESPIVLTKYVSRSMLMKQEGRIINISSIIASTGFNGLSVYGATKASLIGFTKSLARELGKAKITVNSVAPGYMKTDMTAGLEGEKLESIKRRSPLGTLATVDDVAGAITYLLSDDAKHITGTTITIDAGSTA